MRLDKYICECTTLSRTDAKKQIKSGLVLVNDEVCKKAETNIKETDKVTLGSKELKYREFVYLMLNKPDGYICATEDRVYKTYFARLDKAAEEGDIKVFADGMEFKDFTAKNAVLEITSDPCEVIIKISEGKFHQVKRMCEKVGKTVVYLKRLAIGEVELDTNLALGEYRELSEEELNILKKGQ